MQAWRVSWTFAAKTALRAIPWRDAARVDAAVLSFAAGKGGDVVGRLAHDPRTPWLRVRGYLIRLRLDPKARTILVLYVWRSA